MDLKYYTYSMSTPIGRGNPQFTIYTVQDPDGNVFDLHGVAGLKEFTAKLNVGKTHKYKVSDRAITSVGESKGYHLVSNSYYMDKL
mgnify:CR=1 FL=1